MNRCPNCGFETTSKSSLCPNCGHDSNLVIGPAPWWLRLLVALLVLPIGYLGSCFVSLPFALFVPGFLDTYWFLQIALPLLLCWGIDRILVNRDRLRSYSPGTDSRKETQELRDDDRSTGRDSQGGAE